MSLYYLDRKWCDVSTSEIPDRYGAVKGASPRP